MTPPDRKSPYLVRVVAAVVAVALFYFLTPAQDYEKSAADGAPNPPSPEAAGPKITAPDPASLTPPPPPTAEELKTNPRALDPTPLQLSFGAPPFERQDDGTIHKKDVILSLRDLNKSDHETEEDLQLLKNVIGAYHEIFQQNPVAGENWEVVQALTGGNPHKLVFLDPGHAALNARKEILDRWGTPYRFHPQSGSHMEISSAGPDGQFGTADDVTLDEVEDQDS